MELPRKGTSGEAIIKRLHRADRIARQDLREALFAQGFTDSGVDNALARLIKDDRVRRFGAGPNQEYSLTEKMREYLDGCEPEAIAKYEAQLVKPREQKPFTELNKPYRDAMRRAARLDDGHEPMRFLPVATRPNFL